MMDEKERIAPCGLDCVKCPACAEGDACAAAKHCWKSLPRKTRTF